MIKDIAIALLFVIVCLSAGILGSFSTASNIPTWYAAINKPSFNPPNYLFGPVWTFLYISMGVAAFLVWKKGFEKKEVKFALGLFAIQLALNAAWSPLFFGLHWLLISFIEIVVMWGFILWTLLRFYRISVPAGLLLVPYILWVSFASVLNFSIWWLNR